MFLCLHWIESHEYEGLQSSEVSYAELGKPDIFVHLPEPPASRKSGIKEIKSLATPVTKLVKNINLDN